MRIHHFLAQRIDQLGLSQRSLAAALGYDKPNIITMFKQGHTKVPLNKVPELADALQVDRVWLLRLALAEYDPKLLTAIDALLNKVATPNERLIVTELRRFTGGQDPALTTTRQRARLKDLAEELLAKSPDLPVTGRHRNKPLTPPPPGEDYRDD